MKAKRYYLLFIIGNLNTGGAQKQLYLFLKYLDRKKYYFKIACLGSRENCRQYIDKFRSLSVDVDFLSIGREVFFHQTINKIVHYLRLEKPDLVQAHLYPAITYGALAATLARVPFIISNLHTLPASTDDNLSSVEKFERFALTNYPSVLLPCSETVMTEHQKAYNLNPQKMVLFPDAIEIDSYQPEMVKTSRLKESLGLNENDFIFGTVGRLHTHKNHKFLLNAFQRACQAHPESRLIIVGDGELKTSLVKQAEELKLGEKTFFVGEISEVNNFLAIFDVFILPSSWEALSISILEAMLAGLPIIASDIGGVKEVVINGKNGFLVPLNDVDALAEKMIFLRENPGLRAEMGKSARLKVSEDYNIVNRIHQLERLYDSFFKNHPPVLNPTRILVWRLCPWERLVEVINAVKERFGDPEIFFVSQDDTAGKIARTFSVPDESVIEYGKGKFNPLRGFFRVKKQLAQGKFDLMVVPLNNRNGKGYGGLKLFLRLFNQAPIMYYGTWKNSRPQPVMPSGLSANIKRWLVNLTNGLIKKGLFAFSRRLSEQRRKIDGPKF